MGRCWKCNRELRLVGNQWLCDDCDKPRGYKCWNCGFDFTIRDPITKKNLKECSTCTFYICPNCQSCGKYCRKIEWSKIISNILAGQNTLEGSLIISKPQMKIKRIVDWIEDLKKEKTEHKTCPYYVYASYARGHKEGEEYKQGRIKQLLAKMNGIGVKSDLDTEVFRKRISEILDIKIDKSFTIKELREEGRYGQEERDACNLGICMGELRAEMITNKNNQKGIIYTRINSEGRCKYLVQDNFITKRCPNCHHNFNNPKLEYYQPNIEFCPNCVRKRGKKKGAPFLLKVDNTNTFTCNCPYSKFVSINKEDDKDVT